VVDRWKVGRYIESCETQTRGAHSHFEPSC
jgi:hypothetical protein